MEPERDAIRSHYDVIGSSWRHNAWAQDADYAAALRDFARLTTVESLLDVGIGAGDFASLFSAKRIVGIDQSLTMLETCAALHPGFELHHADAEFLPFPPGAFDVVVCRNYLQNFSDPRQAFASMVAAAKPGGWVLVAESAVNRGEEQWPTEFCRVVEPFHPTFPTHEGLRQVFDVERLEDVRQTILSREGPWLRHWMDSRGATPEQHMAGYAVLEHFPSSYKTKYRFVFQPDIQELTSKLTFAALVAKTRRL